MKRACIATIDAARARIFMYQEQTNPGFELTEISDLDNPGRRLKAGEMFSESRPSLASHGGLHRSSQARGNRSDQGNPGTTYDDHRDAHIEEMDTRFAKLAVEEIAGLCRRHQLAHLVLIAAPKMLGTLRTVNGVFAQHNMRVDEIDKDLSGLSIAQLHDYLANADIVPPRQRLKMAR